MSKPMSQPDPEGWVDDDGGPLNPDYVKLRFAMIDLFERYGELDVSRAFIDTQVTRRRARRLANG
jgi:hypothetical protein